MLGTRAGARGGRRRRVGAAWTPDRRTGRSCRRARLYRIRSGRLPRVPVPVTHAAPGVCNGCSGVRRSPPRGSAGAGDRPAAGLAALVRGGVLRHACRIHPSGAARPARSSSRSPDTRNECPRNGICASSGPGRSVTGRSAVAAPPVVGPNAVVPRSGRCGPYGRLQAVPPWPSYPSLTSCRPSVTYGQARPILRELLLPCALAEDDPTVVPRGRIKGLMRTHARAYGPSHRGGREPAMPDPGASAASRPGTARPRHGSRPPPTTPLPLPLPPVERP